jgi:quinolinate synthase
VGLQTDRFTTEFQDKEIVGTCMLCPYMKKVQLDDVLKTLKDPAPEQLIEIPRTLRSERR